MKSLFLVLSLVILTNFLGAQSAGSYDNSFSSDGKEVYSKIAIKPFVFVYNNQVITFVETQHYVNDSITTGGISMIKHSISGAFVSRKVIFSDSLSTLTQMKTYELIDVKQTKNGKFVISFNERFIAAADNYDYTVNLALVSASGVLDNTFDGDGRKNVFSILSGDNPSLSLKIDLYQDNSIMAVVQYQTATGYEKINCNKISIAGVTTNTFNVGTGNYNYICTDVKVNADNTVFLAGGTDFGASPNDNRKHFIFKLTSGFNYNTLFNATGKLFISKGDALPPTGQPTPILLLNSSSTDVYAFLQVVDTTDYLSSNLPTYVQKYNASGAFVSEKMISTVLNPLDILDIKEDNSGKIVTLSTQYDTLFNEAKTYIVRLNPTGLTFDTGFNSNGKKTLSFTGAGITDNYASSMFIQSDNKIITASNTTSSDYLALARINGTAVPTGLIDITADAAFLLYPNPAKDVIKIKSNEGFPYNIYIYNMSGLLVKEAVFESEETEALLSDLVEGLYITKVINTKGISTTTKLIVKP